MGRTIDRSYSADKVAEMSHIVVVAKLVTLDGPSRSKTPDTHMAKPVEYKCMEVKVRLYEQVFWLFLPVCVMNLPYGQ
jgi:hypothetical protein